MSWESDWTFTIYTVAILTPLWVLIWYLDYRSGE